MERSKQRIRIERHILTEILQSPNPKQKLDEILAETNYSEETKSTIRSEYIIALEHLTSPTYILKSLRFQLRFNITMFVFANLLTAFLLYTDILEHSSFYGLIPMLIVCAVNGNLILKSWYRYQHFKYTHEI